MKMVRQVEMAQRIKNTSLFAGPAYYLDYPILVNK
jgi:hypothetical protein